MAAKWDWVDRKGTTLKYGDTVRLRGYGTGLYTVVGFDGNECKLCPVSNKGLKIRANRNIVKKSNIREGKN